MVACRWRAGGRQVAGRWQTGGGQVAGGGQVPKQVVTGTAGKGRAAGGGP